MLKIYSTDGKTRINEENVVKLSDLQFLDFRKRPIIVRAARMSESFSVETLEGVMRGKSGDWLIRGVNGELYPCKDDVFIKTYDVLIMKDNL